MADIRFDGKVAIVTGAGGGLGRQHALELARRGAKVVVNELGASVDGSGWSSEAAAAVVAEIKAAGGAAIANGSSVTDDAGVERMVKEAMDAWDRVDILIANAGVLRDKSFAKMEMADFEFVLSVHLMGTVKPAKAVWETMKAQNYGRIVVTTSSSGLYGNFGQTNYGAAKLGIVGFMNTLKLEGQKNNIHVNAIAPVAATRMTQNLMPPEINARLAPEAVTPILAPSWRQSRFLTRSAVIKSFSALISSAAARSPTIAAIFSGVVDFTFAAMVAKASAQVAGLSLPPIRIKG